MAAARLVDELTRTDLGRYPIAVIGDEPRLAYNRVLLSSVLAGETTSQDIELRPASWWSERGVTLKYGCLATEIDIGRRELKIAGDESIPFSKLVLTTGSSALRLNVPGADLAGVHTFRDSRDVALLLTLAAQTRRVVLVVDDHRQPGAAWICRDGECAEHRGICYGLVEPAYEQGRVLAQHLAGRQASYHGSVVATNLKVSGVSVFSAGDFMGGEGSEALVLNDVRHGTYKKLVISHGRLTGAVLVGDVADALWYLELIRSQQPIAGIRSRMMFGRSLALASEAA